MQRAEIDALVRAHRGRARPVAFFHVLRQPALGPDDHAFLLEHADDLGASDLLRWRARCDEGFTAPVVRQLARRAVADPATFQHEVLDLPRLELSEHEWLELAELVKGKLPAPIYARLLARGGERPPFPPAKSFFTPGKLDSSGLTVDLPSAAGIPAPDVDWSFAVVELPASMKEAVLEKARTTPRGGERANLLAWLEAHGEPRGALLSIALAPLPEGAATYGVVAWLARLLATRAAWDKHGQETMTALMVERAFPEIGELVTMVWSEAQRVAAEPPRGLLQAIQVAFALALIDAVKGALAGGDQPKALAGLSALACLDPPSRVSRAVHELRRAPGAGDEVAELIAVNERLVKHGDSRDASLEGVIAALHVVADAFG